MNRLLPPLRMFAAVALALSAVAMGASADDYVYGWPQNPNGGNFDPAAAAINAVNTTRYMNSGTSFSVNGLSLPRRSTTNHQLRCEARYRSYDRATDTFTGYDGRQRRCRL